MKKSQLTDDPNYIPTRYVTKSFIGGHMESLNVPVNNKATPYRKISFQVDPKTFRAKICVYKNGTLVHKSTSIDKALEIYNNLVA